MGTVDNWLVLLEVSLSSLLNLNLSLIPLRPPSFSFIVLSHPPFSFTLLILLHPPFSSSFLILHPDPTTQNIGINSSYSQS